MSKCSKCGGTDVKFYYRKTTHYKKDGRVAHKIGSLMQPCAACKNKAHNIWRNIKRQEHVYNKTPNYNISSLISTLGH